MRGKNRAEDDELRMIYALLGGVIAALKDPENTEAEGKAAALAALRDGARGLAQALRRARLTYGDPALDDPRPGNVLWDPKEGPQLSPVASKQAIVSAVIFLDYIGNLFSAPDEREFPLSMAFAARLVKVKGWTRSKPLISEGAIRRRMAAERVYQIMAHEALRTGRKPSQKQAIGIVREETGMAVSKIKLGLREYRPIFMGTIEAWDRLYDAARHGFDNRWYLILLKARYQALADVGFWKEGFT